MRDITAAELIRQYASLSDDALQEIDPKDLTGDARVLYESELRSRRLTVQEPDSELDPDWMENAAAACSYAAHPGIYPSHEIDEARAALEAAGITCHARIRHEDATQLYELMVPIALYLHAVSVLDQEIFNPKDLTAGLLDRAERLARAYADERKRRGI